MIPARGGSKRLPRKNVASLRGRPLLAYSIAAARESGLFARVWVSTEDAEIARIAETCGAAIHPRPPALADDAATVLQTALEYASWRESEGDPVDVLCVILPTAVLLRSADLRGACDRFAAGDADVVMGVTDYLESPFTALHQVDGFLRPFFGPEYLRRSQDLPRVCVDSGYFYFCRFSVLRAEQTFYCRRLAGYPIPRDRSIDIDDPVHLRMAEALLRSQSACATESPS